MMTDAPYGLIVTSGEGVMKSASQRFASWMQMSEHSLQGGRFEDLLSPASKIVHATHLVPLLEATGTASEVMLDLVRADGQRFPIVLFAISEPDAGGSEITLHVFDATEIRRHEQELRHAKQEAEAAATALSQANAQLYRQSEALRITLRSIAEGVITIGTDGLEFTQQVQHPLRTKKRPPCQKPHQCCLGALGEGPICWHRH
ncbi:MAG: hypothetical protein C0487_09380 [Leptothrix sp. (in: Bacteria)]|nr:hypothetical protein [Leptothrix sp. (in: b-proteobacteria)]